MPPRDPIAVVIPAYNAAATLPLCLDALGRSEFKPDQIILFDDGSTDDTAAIARAAGVTVLRSGRPRQGPAVGRNIGAAAAAAAIIVFIDADVAVRPDTLAKLVAPLMAGQAMASFGSYDDRPRSRRLAALYANLRHHWVHQQGRSEAFTFWSGIGAIRREIFEAHRGFDPRFTEPSIEDVELGTRIIARGGQIRLVKDAFGTHHKDWGLGQLWKTDVVRRAVPWAQLMRNGRGRADDLNISTRERAAAVSAHLIWLSAAATLFRPGWWPAVAITAAAYVALNARFFVFLFRAGGMRAGFAGMLLHWFYHLYASATFALVSAGLFPLRTRSRMISVSAGRSQATRP